MHAEARKKLLYTMLRIRRVEEAIAREYPKKEMRCPVHLSIGQEATAAAVGVLLSNDDRLYSNHRCHAHYLAKGGNLRRMVAELFGRATGCAAGKGGSMHLVDTAVGMMGSSALVGGTIPLAAGSALALQQAGKDAVAVTFLGDGAAEEGILYETLNFAALKKLPCVFICENNGYATYSALSQRQANQRIYEKARAFGVLAEALDGNDAELLAERFSLAIERAKTGHGPSFFECLTYRWKDHVGPAEDWHLGYRTQAEGKTWQEKCPVEKLKAELLVSGELELAEWQGWETRLEHELDEAFEFARSSPFPEVSSLGNDVYA